VDDGIPLELTVQQLVFHGPPGRLFGVSFVWSSDNSEEGQRWSERIASLGTNVMNTVAVTNIPDWITANGSLVPTSVYGNSRTHSLHHVTPEVAQVVGRNLAKMLPDPGCMFTVHQLRGPSASSNNNNTVFAAREPHYMLEILGYSTTEENKQTTEQWASTFADEVQQETDGKNILPYAYVSLDPADKALPDRIFGSHVQDVLALKKKHDPEDVFTLAVPRLKK
jgi:hypothetical protein